MPASCSVPGLGRLSSSLLCRPSCVVRPILGTRCVLGGAAGAVLAVVDVAVLMQRHGGVSRTVEVPQILRAV